MYKHGKILQVRFGMSFRYAGEVWDKEEENAIYVVCERSAFCKLEDTMAKDYGYHLEER